MRLSVKPALLVIASFGLIVWFFRHEYVTRTLDDVACVERVNRYTRDRCLMSDQVPQCRKIMSSVPCSE